MVNNLRWCLRILLLALMFLIKANASHVYLDTLPKDPNELLAYLDQHRMSGRTSETVFSVASYEKDRFLGRKKYRVLDDGTSKSVIEFLNRSELGQKVLSTNDATWFFTARTKRAIRVPAIQRLYGEASFGDIARFRFSSDYKAVYKDIGERGETITLKLTARDKVSTYQSILLRVSAENFLPVEAHYFVASGKRVKIAEFLDTSLVDGFPVINSWRLASDEGSIKQGKYILISNEAFKFVQIAPVVFTVKYLAIAR